MRRYRVLFVVSLISGLTLLHFLFSAQYKLKSFLEGKSISHEMFATPYDEKLIPFTNWNDSAKKWGREFWEAHKPNYKCPQTLLSRVGLGKSLKADGPKWMCGLQNFGKLTVESHYPCVFYSFGVSQDSSFEAEVLLSTTCSVYAYDPSVETIGRPLDPSNPRVYFQSMGISVNDDVVKLKTLKTLMTENGHEFIDIFKIDVEEAEYTSFEKIFQDFPNKLPFGQLLIELHNNRQDWSEEGIRQILSFVERLEKKGFRLFSSEPNRFYPAHCSEFSFMNLNYRRLFIPDHKYL